MHRHGHIPGTHHYDRHGRHVLDDATGISKPLAQIGQGVIAACVGEARALAGLIPRNQLGRRHAHDALDAIQGHGEDVISDVDQERAIHGNRKGQAHGEGGAFAERRADGNGAAELLHLAVHDVHAHATTRDLGNAFRRRETRRHDEGQHLAVRHFCFGVHEPALDRLGADAIHVDTAPVVRNSYQDVTAFSVEAKANRTLCRLADYRSSLGRLEAMVNRVAQHVLERRYHPLQNVSVYLAFSVLYRQIHRLPQLPTHLANDPLEARQETRERDHARSHESLL